MSSVLTRQVKPASKVLPALFTSRAKEAIRQFTYPARAADPDAGSRDIRARAGMPAVALPGPGSRPQADEAV